MIDWPSWIERLLQTPIDDHRKFVLWRILAPYLINIRKCPADEACNIMRDWLDRRSIRRRLDFNPNYTKKYNINSANREWLFTNKLEEIRNRE